MKQRMHGLSLIELMVAMAISLVLVLGATTVYTRSRATHDQNEAISRLQENARFAMSVVEPDVRAADYWGLFNGGWLFWGRASAADAPAAVASTAAANACGQNYAVSLMVPIWADNNAYRLSSPGVAGSAATCLTLQRASNPALNWTSVPVLTADTLTVRRASMCDPDPNNDGNAADSTCPAPANGRLQVCSSRIGGSLFSDGSACTPWPNGQVGNVVVNTYYIDQNSETATGVLVGVPSLRMKTLTSVGGAIQFQDQEILSGVEDLQVQFGIEPNWGTNLDYYAQASAQRYVNPGDPALAGAQILTVRLWLLVRADAPEPGFADTRIYQYGDRVGPGVAGNLNVVAAAGVAFQPSANGDLSFTGQQRYRRLLITRTIQLRNAMGI